MCMICKLWICQRFVGRKKDVFITLVSVQWFQLVCLCLLQVYCFYLVSKYR